MKRIIFITIAILNLIFIGNVANSQVNKLPNEFLLPHNLMVNYSKIENPTEFLPSEIDTINQLIFKKKLVYNLSEFEVDVNLINWVYYDVYKSEEGYKVGYLVYQFKDKKDIIDNLGNIQSEESRYYYYKENYLVAIWNQEHPNNAEHFYENIDLFIRNNIKATPISSSFPIHNKVRSDIVVDVATAQEVDPYFSQHDLLYGHVPLKDITMLEKEEIVEYMKYLKEKYQLAVAIHHSPNDLYDQWDESLFRSYFPHQLFNDKLERYHYIALIYGNENQQAIVIVGDGNQHYLKNKTSKWENVFIKNREGNLANAFLKFLKQIDVAYRSIPQKQILAMSDVPISNSELESEAFDYLETGDYKKSIPLFLKLVDRKDVETRMAARAYYNIVWMHAVSKESEEAVRVAFEALKKMPKHEHPGFHKMIGNILTEMEQYDEAVEHYKIAAKDLDEDALLWYNYGYNLFSVKKYNEAIPIFLKALDLNLEEVEKPYDTYFYIGTSLSETGKYEESIQWFDKAIEGNKYYSYYFNKAEALVRNGDVLVAIDVCKEGIEAIPGNAELYFKLQQCYNAFGDTANAFEAIEKAYMLDNKDEDILLDYGVAIDKKGETLKAINIYHSILNNNPKNPALVYGNLANVYSKNPNTKDSTHYYYQLSIQANPRLATTYYNYANFFKDDKDWFNALKYYEKAIDLNPNFIPAYTNTGVVYAQLKEPKKVTLYMNKVLELNENDYSAHANLALIAFDNEKDYKKAIFHTSKAIKNHSGQKTIIQMYSIRANSYNILNNNQEAIEDYKKLLNFEITKSERSAVLGNLGYCYMNQKELELSMNAFNDAWSLEPTADIALGQMLLAYRKNENWEKWKAEFYRLEPSYQNENNPVKKLLKDDYHFDEDNVILLKRLLN